MGDPGVCQPVCFCAICAKTAERIDVLFGVETLGDPRNEERKGGSMRPLPNYIGHLFLSLHNERSYNVTVTTASSFRLHRSLLYELRTNFFDYMYLLYLRYLKHVITRTQWAGGCTATGTTLESQSAHCRTHTKFPSLLAGHSCTLVVLCELHGSVVSADQVNGGFGLNIGVGIHIEHKRPK